jgi:hypothetical protein
VPLGTAVTYVGIWLSSVPSFWRPSSVGSQYDTDGVQLWMAGKQRTHLTDELVNGLVDGIGAVVELSGDALGLLGESHAAFRGGVEGVEGVWRAGEAASRVEGCLGDWADGRRVQNEGIAESQARRAVAGDEIQDCVREVGCEDLDQQR